ncbi:MAG: hypothetical protein RIS64_4141 [Bacteroidota bacterium]|jgi:hypothetical protein
MTKLQVQAEMNAQSLLMTVAQLPLNELEQFIQELNRLLTRKKSEDIAQKDKILISKINQTALSLPKIERCNTLILQMEFATLTEAEHQELMLLVEEEEKLRVERVQYLIELAQWRKITLPQLMENLGLKKGKHG